ncbi:MAG: hypothetical protein OHK93_006676 [Ramalina farinacea]|uniref:Sfi1 spindle body domain-containing protein n=1 Tax=Ramalina farinacea TaxID=258253 RepID=A0AA43QLZ0_9LECA|nr:hypothetical protein [Ramalina farinacea]
MPPDPPWAEENDRSEEYPALSDENVAILCEIIETAEAHTHVAARPFRAIFDSYNTVLPQHGLDPGHDQVYLRFLFRLGYYRGPDEGLFQSFERLLLDLGIQISINEGEGAAQDTARELSIVDDVPQPVQKPSAKISRRASFTSLHDAEDESTRALRMRSDGVGLSSHPADSQTPDIPRPSTRATTRWTEKTYENALSSRNAATPPQRERLTANQHANSLQQPAESELPVLAYSQVSNVVEPRPRTPRSRLPTRAISSPSNHSISDSILDNERQRRLSHIRQKTPSRLIPKTDVHLPTRTQLLRDADTFQYYRIRSVAHDIVEKWCDAALQSHNRHEHQQRIASARDKEVLLRQALEHWRTRMHARKQAANSKRFFQHLERRAVRARNLYLLTKAFTHWAEFTRERGIENLRARKHVLRIKYFNAWRDITMENQNKVQKQVLVKFFGLWKQYHVRHSTNVVKADFAKQSSTLGNGYWRWFWSFCGRRAPEWHAGKLKQRKLIDWLQKTRALQRASQLAVSKRQTRLKQSCFLPWASLARSFVGNDRKAVDFQRRITTCQALQQWSRAARLVLPMEQVSNIVDWRVAFATFSTFVNRYRTEKHADNLNRLRLLRSFWTHWNDNLRWRTLAHRLDDRILLEGLYKWVIAERSTLLTRLSGHRLRLYCLQKWKQKLLIRRSLRQDAAMAIEHRRDTALSRMAFRQWFERLAEQKQAERLAVESCAPKYLRSSLSSLRGALKLTIESNICAADARYYFLGKRYVRRWAIAASESRRRKRREAYIQVRRRLKRGLASEMVRRWRQAAAHMGKMQETAIDRNQQRLLVVGTDLFDRWRDLCDRYVMDNLDAVDYHQRNLLNRHLQLWTHQTSNLWKLEDLADSNARLHIRKTAFVTLRRFKLRIIELKAQAGKAEGLRLNYEKRHLSSLLGVWRNELASRQNRPVQTPSFSTRARKTKRLRNDEQLGATRRAEEWTDIDNSNWIPDVEADLSSTPLPGHLSTPSNRAARARALVQSTTPAGTPFQNRLRAQLNSSPRSTGRLPFARSLRPAGSAFGTILEDSPAPGTPRPVKDV